MVLVLWNLAWAIVSPVAGHIHRPEKDTPWHGKLAGTIQYSWSKNSEQPPSLQHTVLIPLVHWSPPERSSEQDPLLQILLRQVHVHWKCDTKMFVRMVVRKQIVRMIVRKPCNCRHQVTFSQYFKGPSTIRGSSARGRHLKMARKCGKTRTFC